MRRISRPTMETFSVGASAAKHAASMFLRNFGAPVLSSFSDYTSEKADRAASPTGAAPTSQRSVSAPGTTPASIDSFTRYHLTAIAVAITRTDAVTIATAADRSDARA